MTLQSLSGIPSPRVSVVIPALNFAEGTRFAEGDVLEELPNA